MEYSPQQRASSSTQSPPAKPRVDPLQAVSLYPPTYDTAGWPAQFTLFSRAFPIYLLNNCLTFFIAILVCDYFQPGGANHSAFLSTTSITTTNTTTITTAYHYPWVALFLVCYYCVLLISRWIELDAHVFYEQFWACNFVMLLSSYGMVTNRPLLTGLSCCIVAVDQMSWYIDIAGWIASGFTKFPVGVAKYLPEPTTSISKRVTAGHHLFFLPLMLWTLGANWPQYSFISGSIIASFMSVLTRFTIPYHCIMPHPDPITGKHRLLYLNVNAAYAFWKDIDLHFLHIFNHRHPCIYLPYLIFTANVILNLPANLLLYSMLMPFTGRYTLTGFS